MRVAVVLAAGRADRFGRQKLVADYRGIPLVRRVARNVLASSVDRVVVVVGHDAERVVEALADLPVDVVRNPEPARGMGSSIRVGVAAVAEEARAVLVVLGDQPEVGPEIADRVLNGDPEGAADVVVPVYREGQANPVLFRRPVFAELLALGGDRGARTVVKRDPGRVRRVVMDRSIPGDVDTPDDLRRLAERSG